ncbi:hypothetical protein SRABI106_02456 [Rahnella aquatilis]|nr:hypothetical protein SRABI106_02456 [Rahnella aquatilis]
MFGQCFDNDGDVGIFRFQTENGSATHAIEWLEDHVSVFFMERFQLRCIAGNQRIWRQFREPRGEQLLVTVAQALRFIDDQRAFFFGTFEDVSGINEFGIERRILTHQDHVQFLQGDILLCAKLIPAIVILLHAEFFGGRTAFAAAQIQGIHFHVMQFVTTTLRFQQHSETGVFFNVDGRDRIHHDAKLNHLVSS